MRSAVIMRFAVIMAAPEAPAARWRPWHARRVDVTRAQGWYYVIGRAWPLVHFRSFEAVAGPKPDRFQTEVTAALFVAVGLVLLAGARRPAAAPVTRTLAVTSALGVAALDWRYRRDLRRVFRLEAALEAAFAGAALWQGVGTAARRA